MADPTCMVTSCSKDRSDDPRRASTSSIKTIVLKPRAENLELSVKTALVSLLLSPSHLLYSDDAVMLRSTELVAFANAYMQGKASFKLIISETIKRVLMI
jgi:hypothetical protein